MVSQSANGLGSGSGIVDSTSRLPVAGAYVRLGAHSGLKSDIARGPKSAIRRHHSITLWDAGDEDTPAEKLATSSRRYILIASESAVSRAPLVRNTNLMRSQPS